MSSTSTYPYKEGWLMPAPNPLYAQSDVLWTEPLGRTIDASSNTQASKQDRVYSSFADVRFFDTEAQSIAASFAEALWVLQQATSIFNKVIYTSSLDLERPDLDLEYDEWVDMPPRAVQKVTMKARFAGRGEPLAILDED